MSKKPRLDLGTVQQQITIPDFHLQNVVATFNLGVDQLKLRIIALHKPFVEYNPQKFAAATMRLKNPRTTALAFASGNMVCTGAKNEVLARLASRKYVRLLQKHGLPVSFRKFKIQNIVASAYVGYNLKLNEISNMYGPYVSYEPDLFPGLVFRTTAPKLVFLLFRSGKIVITGAKSRDEIEQTFKSLYTNIIVKYFDTGTSSSSEYRTQLRYQKHNPNIINIPPHSKKRKIEQPKQKSKKRKKNKDKYIDNIVSKSKKQIEEDTKEARKRGMTYEEYAYPEETVESRKETEKTKAKNGLTQEGLQEQK